MTYEELAEDYWNTMLAYDDSSHNCPTFDADMECTATPDDDNSAVKPAEELFPDVSAEKLERWRWIDQVLTEGNLKGSGTGTEVAGAVSGVLETSGHYGFEFSFWRNDGWTEPHAE